MYIKWAFQIRQNKTLHFEILTLNNRRQTSKGEGSIFSLFNDWGRHIDIWLDAMQSTALYQIDSSVTFCYV